MDDKARNPHRGCIHKMLAIAADIVICTIWDASEYLNIWILTCGASGSIFEVQAWCAPAQKAMGVRVGPWVSERMAGAMDQEQDFPQGFGGGFCFPIFLGGCSTFPSPSAFYWQTLAPHPGAFCGSTSLCWLRNNYPLVIKHGNPQHHPGYMDDFPSALWKNRGVPLPSLIIEGSFWCNGSVGLTMTEHVPHSMYVCRAMTKKMKGKSEYRFRIGDLPFLISFWLSFWLCIYTIYIGHPFWRFSRHHFSTCTRSVASLPSSTRRVFDVSKAQIFSTSETVRDEKPWRKRTGETSSKPWYLMLMLLLVDRCW